MLTPLSTVLQNTATATHNTSRLAWAVHKGSFRIWPQPRPKAKEIVTELYRRARAWNSAYRGGGETPQLLGSSSLRVLESLIYNFLNWQSGRLDPSYEAIAKVTGLARSTVALALARLRALGIISSIRRCDGLQTETGWRLRQITNQYEINGTDHWRGYTDPNPPPPPPDPATTGAHPPLPTLLEQATEQLRNPDNLSTAIGILNQDSSDPLARALAALGDAFLKSENRTETGPKIKR